MRRSLLVAPSFLAAAALTGCQGPPVDFNAEIRPILNEQCVACHGGVRRRGDLSLQFREDALAGGESGRAAIVPGDASGSPLIQLATHPDPEERMPKGGPSLSDHEIERLRKWIDQGAEWEPHWAYVRPVKPEPPNGRGDWARSPVDLFALARMNAHDLEPSPEAGCHVLARRVSLDLIGLPPDPDRVDTLCADATEGAYSDYVDELLAHPGFGERWASMWLDLARYADTKGYEADRHRTIWRYRDWVINAFNADMPFDRFTREQLAGDLLDDPTTEQLIATAFHRNAMTNEEGGTDDEEHRVAAVIDRVNTTWEVWQGITMACTQCHGHPYDPFRQEDYYRSMAVFNNTADWDQPSEEPLLFEFDDPEAGHRVQAQIDAVERELEALLVTDDARAAQADWEASLGDPAVAGRLSTTVQNEVLRIARIPASDRSPHQASFITARFAEVHPITEPLRNRRWALLQERHELPHTTTPILRENPPEQARVTRVLNRGSFLDPADPVAAGVPASLPGALPSNATRLDFADWLLSEDNPLTARVTVNRFWEQLFGRGLVLTLEDFGTVGEPPTHPELLDWLAVSFREDWSWSIKRLLREIVLSSTYRQSSVHTGDSDPDNVWLSRGPRVRLTGEQLRDQALAVGGLLSDRQLGPSVMPPQPDGIWRNPYNGARWETAEDENRYRRAVYTYWKRTAPYPAFVSFDSPSREVCVSRRIRTNTPLQALVALNDPVFWEASEALAQRMTSHEADSDRLRLAFGYRMALGRLPSEAKLDILEGVLEDGDLVLAANVILNLDEFLMRE